MKKYYPALFIQALVCTSIQSAFATESPPQPTMMDEVVVTASRGAEAKKEISSNLTLIDREELDQSAGRNVGDLFAEKGIGNIHKYPGSLTSISIRGFRTDTHGNDLQGHVLVLLDGRRAGTGNLAKILTKNVERIEIIRGPGAVQYGSAGMGGVVNIITRQGKDNSFFLEAGGGSFDTAAGSIGGTIKENGFDFAGSFTYRTRGDYDTGSGDRYYNTGINYETGTSANVGYSFTKNNRLGIIFTRFEVDEAGSAEFFSANDLDDTTDKENYSVDANYTGATPSVRYQWMGRYFFGKDENSWTEPTGSDPTGWDDGIASANKTDQQGAQAQVTGTFEASTITAGFDWLDYAVENSWTPNKTNYTNPALFLLGKTAFLDDRLTANIGLRSDWYEVEVKEPAGRNEEQSRLTPKIGLAWMVIDGLKLRAQYAQGFMMPSADQLAADFISFGSRVVGNRDLDPEKSATYEGGLDFSKNGFNATFTYFYTNFEDKIATDYLADGSKTWKNLGDATISGFETELSYDLGIPLDWSWEVRPYLNLSLLTRYEDDTTGEDLQYVSGANYSTGFIVGNGDGFFCRFNVTYAGSQDVQDWESGTYPTPVVKLDSNTVADLTASRRFYENDNLGALTLRGEVRNLFDEDYAYVKGYPMPGRSIFIGLRWEY
ncbi:MAG: TonB-dependent receptor [Desulfobulbaceae bacterium]|nr:TonB-dependent receptor [Desulfobulbaceae bacterium]